MPKFLTIGYGDEAGYNRTAQAVRDAAHAQDESLRADGALIGIAGAPVLIALVGKAHAVEACEFDSRPELLRWGHFVISWRR